MAIKIQDIATESLKHADFLLRSWLPDGKAQGKDWVALNPTRKDKHHGSFRINIDSGQWLDHATGDKGGDLVSLYAYLNHCGQRDAAVEVAREIGVDSTQTRVNFNDQAAHRSESPTTHDFASWWDKAEGVSNHPYLSKKGVKSYGLRLWKGMLLIPLMDSHGRIVGIQTIDVNGDKKFVKGSQMKGSAFFIDGKAPYFLAEGYATAATVREATGQGVYVAFNAGNLKENRTRKDVAWVAADNDKNQAGEKAAIETGLVFALPPELGDWNDYGTRHGHNTCLEAIKQAIGEGQTRHKRSQADKELEPLLTSDETPTLFPLNAFPRVIREGIEAMAYESQAAIELAAFITLSYGSWLAQSRVDALGIGGEPMPCSLFLLSLAESGERKSTMDKMLGGELLAKHREQCRDYQRDFKDWEINYSNAKKSCTEDELKSVEACKPHDPTEIVRSDISVSRLISMLLGAGGEDAKPSIFWSSDEGGQIFDGHSLKGDDRTAVVGSLIKLYDEGSTERWRSKANGDGSGSDNGKRLTINALVQPAVIKKALNDELLQRQGFLPRFLLTAPKPLSGTRLRPLRRHKEPNPALEKLKSLLEQRYQERRELSTDMDRVECKALQWGDGVFEFINDLYLRFEPQLAASEKYASIRAFANRIVENSIRVATVIAFILGKEKVDLECIECGAAVAEYSVCEWERYLEGAQANRDVLDAQVIVDWLERKIKQGEKQWKVFTAREFSQRGANAMRRAKRRDPALSVLVDKGYLIQKDKNFVVSPALLKKWKVS